MKGKLFSLALASFLVTASALMTTTSFAGIRTVPATNCVRTTQRDLSGYWSCPFVSDNTLAGKDVSTVFIDFRLQNSTPVSLSGKACRTRFDGDAWECGPEKKFTGTGGKDLMIDGGWAIIGNGSVWDYHFAVLNFPAGADIALRGIAGQGGGL